MCQKLSICEGVEKNKFSNFFKLARTTMHKRHHYAHDAETGRPTLYATLIVKFSGASIRVTFGFSCWNHFRFRPTCGRH